MQKGKGRKARGRERGENLTEERSERGDIL